MAATVTTVGNKPLPSWNEEGEKTDFHLIITTTVVHFLKNTSYCDSL